MTDSLDSYGAFAETLSAALDRRNAPAVEPAADDNLDAATLQRCASWLRKLSADGSVEAHLHGRAALYFAEIFEEVARMRNAKPSGVESERNALHLLWHRKPHPSATTPKPEERHE